ncbi:MAG: hypothetical protein ABIG84_07405 [archaeon]
MNKKKAAILAYPEVIMIIFALALGILLFSIANKFGSGVKNSFVEDNLEGEPKFVAEYLVTLSQDCWKLNKKGAAPNSDVCFTIKINATDNVTETLFNEFLDCEYLPNNHLNLDNIADNKCGKEDKVYWELIEKDTEVKIAYSASRRRIEIIETDALCLGQCCIAKCDDRCRDFEKNCEEMHSKCSGPVCDGMYTECMGTVVVVCDKCIENC